MIKNTGDFIYKFDDSSYKDIIKEMLEDKISICEIAMQRSGKFSDDYKIINHLDLLNLNNSDIIISLTIEILYKSPFRFVQRGKLNIDIHKSEDNFYCEITDIFSEDMGLGGILFYNMVLFIGEIELFLHTNCLYIYGDLVEDDKEINWNKSIPFYCMQTSKYDYIIKFYTSDNTELIYDNSLYIKEEQYTHALEFTEKYKKITNSGHFNYISKKH